MIKGQRQLRLLPLRLSPSLHSTPVLKIKLYYYFFMKRIKLSKNNKIFKLFFLVSLLIIFCILLVFVYKKPKTKVENMPGPLLKTVMKKIKMASG